MFFFSHISISNHDLSLSFTWSVAGTRIYGRCDLRQHSMAHSVHHCGSSVLCCPSRELPMQSRVSRFGSIKISLSYHVRTNSRGTGELL